MNWAEEGIIIFMWKIQGIILLLISNFLRIIMKTCRNIFAYARAICWAGTAPRNISGEFITTHQNSGGDDSAILRTRKYFLPGNGTRLPDILSALLPSIFSLAALILQK